MLPKGSGTFTVDEPVGSRWAAAIELLAEGGYIVCMGLGMTFRSRRPGKAADGILHVIVESRWDPERLTSVNSDEQLQNAKAGIEAPRQRSADFDRLLGAKRIDYELIHTYGMGAISLATLVNDNFTLSYHR